MHPVFACLLACALAACGDVSLRDMQEATESTLDAEAAPALQAFYGSREYAPLWTQRDQLRGAGDTLVTALCRAADDLLDPEAYGVTRLGTLHREAYLQPPPTDSARAQVLAALEVGLSQAFLAYVRDRRGGAARPEAFAAPPLDTTALLGWTSLSALRASLAAPQEGAAALLQAYRRYRLLADSSAWPSLAATVQPGAPEATVQRLRLRLALTGDLADAAGHAYDEALLDAVRRFQTRHGLLRTGLVDEPTRAALNVPAAVRAQQLAASVERRRWLPPAAERPYLLVNLADQRVYGFRGGREVVRTSFTAEPGCAAAPPLADSVATVAFGGGTLRLALRGSGAVLLGGGTTRAEGACWRAADAAALGTFVLEGTGAWGDAEVQGALASASAQAVALTTPVPVFVLPLSAWVDADGLVHFRPPHPSDAPLARALRPTRPRSVAAACTAFVSASRGREE